MLAEGEGGEGGARRAINGLNDLRLSRVGMLRGLRNVLDTDRPENYCTDCSSKIMIIIMSVFLERLSM